MFLNFANDTAVFGRIDADHLCRAGQCDELLVGGNVGGEDGVGFVADLDNRLAVADVVDDDLAGLAAATAAGEQERTVAAEFEYLRSAHVEWEHADQLHRVAVIE